MGRPWLYQVRGRLRARLDPRLARDLAGLVENAGGCPDALIMPRSGRTLPLAMPYAFAQPIPPGVELPGPAFGSALAYDGSRFDGLSGAAISGDELRLGVMAENLHYAAMLDLDGRPSGPPVSRLWALLDFLGEVLAAAPGEVVGRIGNGAAPFAQPLMRCADGRIRVVHAGASAPALGPRNLLPATIPAFLALPDTDEVADLDEEGLALWFRGLRIESGPPGGAR